jgi:hypothetical protein
MSCRVCLVAAGSWRVDAGSGFNATWPKLILLRRVASGGGCCAGKIAGHGRWPVAGSRLTDWISLGVLASSVPRDAVDEAVTAAGRAAKRSDGKLPPHVMVYFAMALALFAEEDYEEVAARLTETLASWGCWDQSWTTPTSGGITQARKRLGPEPLELLFGKVAVPVAGVLTRGRSCASGG